MPTTTILNHTMPTMALENYLTLLAQHQLNPSIRKILCKGRPLRLTSFGAVSALIWIIITIVHSCVLTSELASGARSGPSPLRFGGNKDRRQQNRDRR
jgi:hypothetical protein